MTVNGWIQILALLRDRRRAREAARRLHDARLQRRAHLPLARPAAGRDRALQARSGVDESAGAALAHLRGRHAASSTPLGFLVLYLLQRLQGVLPFNPAGMAGRRRRTSPSTPPSSFMTNTNWQNYGGESTMSYLVQMAGLTVQNFVSAATGIAHRGRADPRLRAAPRPASIGNFWVDLTRCTLYVLLPLCIVLTLFYVWRGVPQTLGAYVDATTLEGAKQTIAVGPGRLAARDQDARHQWRRLLQRQLRASLREPGRARRTSSRW